MKPNTRVDPNTPPPQLPPAMPKVNSGLDPDNPEQGEYTALTEYQYAHDGKMVSKAISTQTGLPSRYLFRSKNCRWNKGPMPDASGIGRLHWRAILSRYRGDVCDRAGRHL